MTQAVTEEELVDDEYYEDTLEEMKTQCGKFGKFSKTFEPCKDFFLDIVLFCCLLLALRQKRYHIFLSISDIYLNSGNNK